MPRPLLPFLPADEFFDDGHFPWFAELSQATDAIRAELVELIKSPGEALRPYVRMESGIGENKWSGLDNSLDWGAIFLWEYGEANRPVLERCPETAKVLESLPVSYIPGRAPSAFFSMLKPHRRIPPHTGVTNTRAIIHLPLIVPQGCGFRVGGEVRPWVVGKPFAFDDTIEHEAWNDSDELRSVPDLRRVEPAPDRARARNHRALLRGGRCDRIQPAPGRVIAGLFIANMILVGDMAVTGCRGANADAPIVSKEPSMRLISISALTIALAAPAFASDKQPPRPDAVRDDADRDQGL